MQVQVVKIPRTFLSRVELEYYLRLCGMAEDSVVTCSYYTDRGGNTRLFWSMS